MVTPTRGRPTGSPCAPRIGRGPSVAGSGS
jgi:hypothetical protein